MFQRPKEQYHPHPDVTAYIVGDIDEAGQHLPLAGGIFFAKHQQVAISSSELRANITQYHNDFLPVPVCDYIKQHRLYQ